MGNKIKNVKINYPNNMKEINKRYGKVLAQIVLNSLTKVQINELFNEIK